MASKQYVRRLAATGKMSGSGYSMVTRSTTVEGRFIANPGLGDWEVWDNERGYVRWSDCTEEEARLIVAALNGVHTEPQRIMDALRRRDSDR